MSGCRYLRWLGGKLVDRVSEDDSFPVVASHHITGAGSRFGSLSHACLLLHFLPSVIFRFEDTHLSLTSVWLALAAFTLRPGERALHYYHYPHTLLSRKGARGSLVSHLGIARIEIILPFTGAFTGVFGGRSRLFTTVASGLFLIEKSLGKVFFSFARRAYFFFPGWMQIRPGLAGRGLYPMGNDENLYDVLYIFCNL